MKQAFTTKELALTGIFTAIMIVIAQINIPLPFTPIPLTLAMLAIYVSSAVLPLKCGIMVQAIYLLLGMLGLPVFAGFRGGFVALFGPTGGFLISYLFMALIVGALSPVIVKKTAAVKAGKTVTGIAFGAACLLALIICYLFGAVWLMRYNHITFLQAVGAAVLPFIPLDIVKIVLAALVIPSLRRALSHQLILG